MFMTNLPRIFLHFLTTTLILLPVMDGVVGGESLSAHITVSDDDHGQDVAAGDHWIRGGRAAVSANVGTR